MLEELVAPIPPYPELLTHNHSPSDIEKRSILDALSGVYAKISMVDAELERLARLQSAKQELERFRDEHEGVISPLRRVPNEILGEIMKHCHNRANPEKSSMSAMVLASVCSRWRAVALSTPQLWAVLVYRLSQNSVHLTNLMLLRSGDYDLEWHVYGHEYDYSWPVIDALHPHLPRVCDIFSENAFQTRATLALQPSFQRLRTVKLTFTMVQHELFLFFQSCPVLEDAEVEISVNIQTDFFSDVKTHDMPKLRRLRLAYHEDPSEFLEHITTPNLVEIGSVVLGTNNWPVASVMDLIHRSKCSLKTLGLAWTDSDPLQMCQLLDAVPHLEELLTDEVNYANDTIYEYLSIQADQLSKLTKLKTLIIHGDIEEIEVDSLHNMLTSRSAEYPLSNVVINFQTDPPDREILLCAFSSLIQDAEPLGYTLEFRDKGGFALNIETME